jgi:peroxiredoxin
MNAQISNGQMVQQVIADGSKIYTDSSLNKMTYTEEAATNLNDLMGALQRRGGGGVGLLPILLSSPDAVKQIIPGGGAAKVTRQPDETIDGVACDILTAEVGEAPQGTRIGFAFGKQDHLLRRVSLGPAGQEKPSVTETHTNVTTSPKIADNLFTYVPAPGAVATAAPKEPERFDSRLKAGAEPLAITGKDLGGKDVSFDQYKGKVVLVDFWAIWCGPCIAELPNVVSAYNKYHDQGFDVLGISLDRPDEKEKLEKFIVENKMPWRQVYDGGYWEAANAVAWGVKAIPFTVLIGKDGKIVDVNLRGEALAPAIEAALKK